MSQSQTIEVARAGRPQLTFTVVEQFQVRFYATLYSENAEGRGWAQSPSGRYWRLDVPPPVYQALIGGNSCAVLWQGDECLGAVDWEGHEEEPPNATAYHLDLSGLGEEILPCEGEVTCAADRKRALLGRIDVDPDPEWWLVVPD